MEGGFYLAAWTHGARLHVAIQCPHPGQDVRVFVLWPGFGIALCARPATAHTIHAATVIPRFVIIVRMG
jgi:hypothetical protein